MVTEELFEAIVSGFLKPDEVAANPALGVDAKSLVRSFLKRRGAKTHRVLLVKDKIFVQSDMMDVVEQLRELFRKAKDTTVEAADPAEAIQIRAMLAKARS